MRKRPSATLRLAGFGLMWALAATMGLTQGVSGETTPALKVMSDFTYKDVDGTSVSFSSLKGKAYVVDLWATWCAPCKKEIPDLMDLEHKYQDQGLKLIGISMDDEGAKVVKPYVVEHKMDYTILVGDVDSITKVVGDEITILPDTYFVDSQHRIRSVLTGYAEASEIEKNIKALLAAK